MMTPALISPWGNVMSDRSAYIPHGPRLHQLFGMREFREWAEDFAQDLIDWSAKHIAWSDVSRSALLYGPPGTGKTLAVIALAATCNLPLIVTSYAQWQRSKNGHLGDVLAAMHEVFEFARRRAPCILFIDEFEAIGSRALQGTNQNWYTAVITALNEEFNELSGHPGLVVIAAANYPDRIDAALLRSGRLDTKIALPMPTAEDLKGIIRFHLKGDLANVSLGGLAVAARGMTGADIERAVRIARRRARRFRRPLLLNDLFAVLGEKIQALPHELVFRMAIHEAGHAIAAIVFNVSNDVSISLFQVGNNRATTNFDPQVEAVTRKVVNQRIAVALAGRAAEEVLLGEPSAGAGGDEYSDLGMARDIARSAILLWGLSTSPDTRWGIASDRAIRREVKRMLDLAYAQALGLIREREWQVRAVAHALVKRRALAHEDIIAVMAGERQGTIQRRQRQQG
jgi:cell division protease FtsH